MPIRLNLLAEEQAAEEQRRRDPVKRAVWIGALLIVLMLVWSISIQFKAILARKQLSGVESQMTAITNDYLAVVEKQTELNGVRDKLESLRSLATNRFLNGNLLNALQKTTADDIQLIRLKVDQIYALNEETKARTNGNRVTPAKPATVTEKISVTLEGTDGSPSPGDEVIKFQEVIASNPYFQAMLGKTNEVALKNVSAPNPSPETGKPCVLFTLECRYPEKVR